MHRIVPRFLLPAAVCLALVSGTSSAQAGRSSLPRARADTVRNPRLFSTIDGIVSDTNLVPIHAAFVSILSTKIRVGTGPNGRFRITNVPPGQYLVIVKRVGFSPTSGVVDVPASDTLRLSYTLSPVSSQSLDPVVITEKALSTKLREFAARRRLGEGQFLGPEEIDRANTVFATELFRKFTSLNVSPSLTSAMPEYYPLSRREGGNLSLGACPMQVYLDQVALPTPFNLDLLPSPKELAAIEVYAGASTIPPQFNGFNRGCGVILVWTKDGY